MGSVRQNKKRRSSKPKIRQSQQPKKPLNPRGNTTVAQNWDKNETLTQNYRRLGLTSRLKAPSGGIEKSITAARAGKRQVPTDPLFSIQPLEKAVVSSARIERDADGNIVKIHYDAATDSTGRKRKIKPNPLNDPLAALDSNSEDDNDEDMEEWGGIEDGDEKVDEESRPKVIRMLEEEANRPVEKRPRHQSEREREWVESLVSKHKDNYRAMARDKRLNPMQQTEADISRRIKKWKESQ